MLGNGVGVASDLEEANKHYGSSVLISDATLQQPGVLRHFATRCVDVIPQQQQQRQPHGHQYLRIHEVMGRRDAPTRLCQFEGTWARNVRDMHKDVISRGTLNALEALEVPRSQTEIIKQADAHAVAVGKLDKADYSGAIAAFRVARKFAPGYDIAPRTIKACAKAMLLRAYDASVMGNADTETWEALCSRLEPPDQIEQRQGDSSEDEDEDKRSSIGSVTVRPPLKAGGSFHLEGWEDVDASTDE